MKIQVFHEIFIKIAPRSGQIIDFFIQNVIAEKLPLPIVLLINIVSLAVIIYLANQYLIPLETDISNSIIQNVFQQVSNMNIFEQL